jgi:hypothetical protein
MNNMPTYIIKVAKKPSFTVSNTTHHYVAHTFNYPGRITWDPVEMTLVDPVLPDASALLTAKLQQAGYRLPTTELQAQASFGKKFSSAAWGDPKIAQIDAEGLQIDEWTLKNAWVERVDFGQLDYTNEEMVNIMLTFRYDYAEYRGAPREIGAPLRDVMVGGQTVTKSKLESFLTSS